MKEKKQVKKRERERGGKKKRRIMIYKTFCWTAVVRVVIIYIYREKH